MPYPRSIHLVSIIGVLCLFLIMCRSLDLIKFNIAKFKYPDVIIALYDQDWKGSPYVIREVTTHRWYEIGEFAINTNFQERINNIVDRFNPYFSIDLNLIDSTRYLSISQQSKEELLNSDNQNSNYTILCLDQQFLKVDKIKNGIMKDVYQIKGNTFIEIHNLDHNIHIHDYEVRFDTILEVTGLSHKVFLIEQIQEYYISRSLHLLEDSPMLARNRFTQF